MSDPHGDQDTGLPARQGPLVDVKVLDLGVLIAGPLVSCYMSDLGADVVKVERPTGDPCRLNGRYLDNVSLTWKYFGRNKRTIAVDFATAEGRDQVLALAGVADVVVENFRPGTLEKWRLGYDDLRAVNPNVILTRISGFGQEGPYSGRPGFGTIAESMAGFTGLNGSSEGPPALPPVPLADSFASMAATIATLAALHRRNATGEGEQIDVSLIEPLFSLLGCQLIDFTALGIAPKRMGNRLEFAAPRGAYLCADDSWFAISGATPASAKRIFEAVGMPDFADDPRLATNAARSANADLVDEIIQKWASTQSRNDAVARLEETGAAVGPIYTLADIVEDSHFIARPTFEDLPDADLGSVRMPAVFAKLKNNPGKVRFGGRPIDADRSSVLRDWLGVSSMRVSS